MTILEAAAALRARKVTARQLAEQSFAAIAELNPRLNAVITVMQDTAMAQAARADDELSIGLDRGPLQGIPVAVKDVFETHGVRTTCGSKLFENNIPDKDAAVVEKLHAAGAVLVGKTTMHEMAFGITSNNPHFGAVRNPWNPDCIPGGSSGGSGSAVASGMVLMAMGTDTGGSIRIPAAFCGTVGLKPTFGRVSRYGAMPLDFTLDHMGPLTRSVRDAAVVLQAIAGHDDRDDTSSTTAVGNYVPEENPNLKGLRVGVPTNYYFDRLTPEVDKCVRHAIQLAGQAGAEVTPVEVPDIDSYNVVARVIVQCEASALMEPYLDRPELFGADVLALFEQGRLLSAPDYINAQRLRRLMQREFHQVWRHCDCLLTPCAPCGAPKIGEATIKIQGVAEDVRLASTRLVRAINMLGLPGLSVPVGLDKQNLPVGLQIVGRAFDEATVLRVGQAIEHRLKLSLVPPVSSNL